MRRDQKTRPEQVVLMLRQIEVQTAQGKSLALFRKEAESPSRATKDECLKSEIYYSLKEAQTAIGMWQTTYNRVQLHLSLGYRPPAPVTFPELVFRLPMAAKCRSLPIGCLNRSGFLGSCNSCEDGAMTKRTAPFSPEVRERAVRMVFEHRGEHGSRYAVIRSIAAKISCSGETLRNWVR